MSLSGLSIGQSETCTTRLKTITLIRIPFYYLFKTTFLLYLALPQTQGSTYIYTRHLYPFLQTHESEIDKRVVEAKSRLFEWIRIRLRTIWEGFGGAIPQSSMNATTAAQRSATPVDTPPTLIAPMTNPLQLALGLWHTYSPAIGAFLQQPIPTASPVTRSPSPRRETRHSSSPPPQVSSAVEIHTSMDSKLSNREALLARRRALEAELAALNAVSELEPTSNPTDTSTSTGNSDAGTSASTFAATLASTAFSAMSTYLPGSSAPDDRGRYEEIARDELEDDNDDSEMNRDRGQSRWWWNSGTGYERLKTE